MKIQMHKLMLLIRDNVKLGFVPSINGAVMILWDASVGEEEHPAYWFQFSQNQLFARVPFEAEVEVTEDCCLKIPKECLAKLYDEAESDGVVELHKRGKLNISRCLWEYGYDTD